MTNVTELSLVSFESAEPANLVTTEGFAEHQHAVSSWLDSTANAAKFDSNFAGLIAVSNLYGNPIEDDANEFITSLTDTRQQDPTQVRLRLRQTYIGLVVLSPFLSTFQKGDLLTRVAQSYDHDEIPANGNKIVTKNVKAYQRLLERTEAVPAEAAKNRLDHVAQLTSLVKEWLPPMTRRDYYRHAASKVAGEEITNVLKAVGILVAYTEQPDPKAKMRAEARFAKRLPKLVSKAEKRRNKAIQHAQDAAAEYNTLRSQQPLTIEDLPRDDV